MLQFDIMEQHLQHLLIIKALQKSASFSVPPQLAITPTPLPSPSPHQGPFTPLMPTYLPSVLSSSIVCNHTNRQSDITSRNEYNYSLEKIGDGCDHTSVHTCSIYTPLLRYDQLLKERQRNNIFYQFQEGTILFPPTYKFDKRSSRYDSSSKKRVPSWTDRILYSALKTHRRDVNTKAIDQDNVVSVDMRKSLKLIEYYSEDSDASDHRPVVANFLFECI